MENYSERDLKLAVADNRIYDYIAEHYWEMPRDDLKEVLLAVLGVCYDKCYSDADERRLMEDINGELESRFFGED